MVKARILLAEDDRHLRETIAFNLMEEGYTVTEVANGRAAIGTLQTSAHSPAPSYDIVFTDIVMGEVSGIEVMYTARTLPDAPEVILLTGHGSLETAISAVRAGAFDYLLKPCSLDVMLQCVADAVQHRANKQQYTEAKQMLERFARVVTSSYGEASDTVESPPTIDLASSPHHRHNAYAADMASVDGAAPLPAVSNETSYVERVTTSCSRYRQVGALQVDTHRHEIFFQGTPLHVTPTEYDILAYLASIPGRVASFGDIVRHIRDDHVNEEEARDLLRSHIHNLRQKLDRRYLVNVRGFGYILAAPE